jgi:hypothetical protein
VADGFEIVLRGKRFDIARREVATRGGGSELREVVLHPGAVVILPLLEDGRVVLIRNARFTVGQTLWELPAGTREPGEEPTVCAARELSRRSCSFERACGSAHPACSRTSCSALQSHARRGGCGQKKVALAIRTTLDSEKRHE